MSIRTKKYTLDSLGQKVDSLGTTVTKLVSTVDKLASAMERGFNEAKRDLKAARKEAKEDNESLARLTAEGFEQVNEHFKNVEARLNSLEQGQENIQLRIDGLAPQFEVKGLERRVKRLEEKAGIRQPI